MNIFELAKLRPGELKRVKDVTAVMARYGFGEIFRHIPIPGKFILPGTRKEIAGHTPQQRLSMALEELGTTYIKLGQFASSRPDILPEGYLKELKRLQDDVSPAPLEEIEKIFIGEWGEEWREKFITFIEEPVASASIAQVYRARTASGRSVALKVIRPGVREKVSADIRLIKMIAGFIEDKIPEASDFQLRRLSEEFTITLNRELDFKREAIILQNIRKNHSDMEDVLIPAPVKKLSGKNILAMDFIEGIPLDKAVMTRSERKKIALAGLKAFFRQALRDGLFHADPHPGNMLFTPDGKLSYLDFGMVGRLSFSMRKQLIDLLLSIHSSRPEWALQEVLAMGEFREEVDRESLLREIMEITDRYIKVPVRDMSAGGAALNIASVMKKYRITVNPVYALVARALAMAEETGKKLAPGMDPLKVLEPELKKVYLERFKPSNLIMSWKLTGKSFSRFLSDIPFNLGQILKKLKTGQLEIEFRHVGLEGLIQTLDRLSNRLTFGLIISALIVGSSLVIQTDKGPSVMGLPALGFGGFLIALVMGVWLLWSIIRSGRL